MVYCEYYQAHIPQKTCWLFVALLRSCEHVAFDRTFDIEQSIFEFFVPSAMEKTFLSIMHWLGEQGLVVNLNKLPNRLLDQKSL